MKKRQALPRQARQIPVRILNKLAIRKEEKGINQIRSIEDALNFALLPENKKNWW